MTNLPERFYAHEGDERVEYVRADMITAEQDETGSATSGKGLPNDPENVPEKENIGPVAWRYRYNGQWYLSQNQSLALNGFDVQPLYASPPAEPDAWQHRRRIIGEPTWGEWQDGPLPFGDGGELTEVQERPLYASPPAPTVAVPEVTSEMVEAGLLHYSEGGCMGLAHHERREVVEAILHAALAAAPQPPATRSYEEGIEAAAKWLDHKAREYGTRAVEFPNGHLADQSAKHHRDLAAAIRSLADEPRHGE